jgi:D-serine dehydratase
MQIIIETQKDGDPASLFDVIVDSKTIAEGLTAAQAHVLVGELLERLVLTGKSRKAAEKGEVGPR